VTIARTNAMSAESGVLGSIIDFLLEQARPKIAIMANAGLTCYGHAGSA
jgi:hypothetical protein